MGIQYSEEKQLTEVKRKKSNESLKQKRKKFNLRKELTWYYDNLANYHHRQLFRKRKWK